MNERVRVRGMSIITRMFQPHTTQHHDMSIRAAINITQYVITTWTACNCEFMVISSLSLSLRSNRSIAIQPTPHYGEELARILIPTPPALGNSMLRISLTGIPPHVQHEWWGFKMPAMVERWLSPNVSIAVMLNLYMRYVWGSPPKSNWSAQIATYKV